MANRHFVRFVRARSLEDVATFSVAYFYEWKEDPPIRAGDSLVGVPVVPIEGGHMHLGRGLDCKVTDVSEVKLLEELTEEELGRLGCDLDTFFESWAKLHPDAPEDPLVIRVQFEPTDEVVPVPKSAEQMIVEVMAQVAHDEIIAIEDARTFSDIDQALNPSPA